jgi:hypothetical protein
MKNERGREAGKKRIIGAPCLACIAYWPRGHWCANILDPIVPRATTIGGPMVSYLKLEDGTKKEKIEKKRRTKQFGAPCLYFQANRLLTELYEQETEIHWRKNDGHTKN